MEMIWHIRIPEEGLELLHTKMLGLTFFERRLREAKLAKISKVIFSCQKNFSAPKIKTKFCAPYEVTNHPLQNEKEVPLYGLISIEQNPKILVEINSIDDFPKAKKYYRQQIISASGAGWVAKRINKTFSLPVSSRLSNTFITPNMWTFINMAVGVASAFFISSPGYVNGLIGGLLLQLASIFDGVDGEIAKFRYETSKWGAVLDSIADNGTLIAFLSGLIYFYTQNTSGTNSTLFLAGTVILAFLLIAEVWVFVHKHFDSNSLVTFDNKFLKNLPSSDPLVRIAKSSKDYIKKDFYSAIFFLCCFFGKREYVLYLVFMGALMSLIVITWIAIKYSPSKIRATESR